MRDPFGARLAAAVSARGPLCVGIDPHTSLLEQWDLPVDVTGLERFATTCVEAFAGQVAVVKPQSAFFEAHGSAGVAVLEWLIAAFRDTGTLVLLDVKRGDIGSTMAAYAQAYLGEGSPLAADAVTVSPYLGFGSLAPALDLAEQTGRGVFVLALTSNQEGPQVQRATGGNGVSVAQTMVDEAAARNAGASPMGSVGLVIGATVGRLDLDLSVLNGPVLAPGFGAQGAGVAELKAVFGDLRHLLPTSSRDILRHGPDAMALREAALRVRDSLG
ncbi:orotidine-5'-phosphate decarboxylase [Actinophytocola sp.]|uniref:orotidine-5'-phosphate decarboxylase n=1 Tax=Actinophytocola sp. TaxID=1872138 RepID=UPI002ED0526C